MKEVWVISGMQGSYEDTVTWIQQVCATEELATEVVRQLKEDYISGLRTYQKVGSLIEPLINEMYDQFDEVDWELVNRSDILDKIETEYSEKIFKVSGYSLDEFERMKQSYDYDDEPFYRIERQPVVYDIQRSEHK